MAKLVLPAETLQKMICTLCKNHLSYFPIHISDDSSSAICGRCDIPEIGEFLHDKAYEGIAQFLVFPCRYSKDGCTEQLTPPKMVDHEKLCQLRKLECPNKSYLQCQWQGPFNELRLHFETKHSSLFIKDNEFKVDFGKCVKDKCLLCFDQNIFIVKREIDSLTENFMCSVQHLRTKDSENYEYFIKLVSDNKTYSCSLPRKNTNIGSNTTTFDKNFVKEKLIDCDSFTVNVYIDNATGGIVEDVKKQVIKKDPNINWDLLAELECPVCFDSMLPPIHQCLNGHSICSACKPKLSACPTCKVAIQNTRNIILEKMTEHLIYPCKFHKDGCLYSSKPSEIRKHEENCELGLYECPLEDCQSKMKMSLLLEHFENNHDSLLKSDRINKVFSNYAIDEDTYFIKFSGRLFKLHYIYANQLFQWALQLVGPADESKSFMFEIDVMDNSGRNRKSYLRGVCLPLKESSVFSDNSKHLSLTLNQVRPLIAEDFSYRVRVVRA